MYLQLNTRFNPFTYDEMVKPLLYYKQAYDATEAAYSDLVTRAEQWKAIADSDDSPMAKAMYQNYSNDLSSIVSDFSNGMTASNRSALLDMRRRYSREIQPIEIAFKRRAQLDDEQRKAIASDPTMLYQRRANEMSLDDFIKNPSLDYGQGYSGAMLTKQVAQAASGMAKEARDSAEGRRKLRALLPYQYELIQQNGFSRDAVMKAIMNSPDADRILTGLVDNAIASSGVLDWGDEETIARAYDYARQGLWSAIGDTKSQVITDSYGMQSQLAKERAAAAATKGTGKAPAPYSLTGRVNNFYSEADNSSLISTAKDLYSRSDRSASKNQLGLTPKVFLEAQLNAIDQQVKDGTMHRWAGEEAKAMYRNAYRGEGSTTFNAEVDGFLGTLGYNEEAIGKMPMNEKLDIIESVSNSAPTDAIGRRVYSYQLNNSAFESLKENWSSLSKTPTLKRIDKIEGGQYVYGKDKDINDLYDEGVAPVVHIDPLSGEFILQVKGDRYKIPVDLIGTDTHAAIQRDRVNVEKGRQLINDVLSGAIPITPEVEAMVVQAQRMIDDYDAMLEGVVTSLGYEVGNKNIAK